MINTLIYQYWLLSSKVITQNKKTKLFRYFGDAYHVYFASESELKGASILMQDELYEFLKEREILDINKSYESFMRSPYGFVTLESNEYPKNLKDIYDPPYGLFYYGKLGHMNKVASIVGARRCSEYGKRMAYELGQILSDNGYTVVSGMAKGIDSYAHKGCLTGASNTIAVLGSGVDVIYPKENRLLYEEITQKGAVMSEFLPGTQPLPIYFPIRNRIVSGMSDLVIVVEARIKSGSLITADLALEQGKDIYAVPGRVGDSLSEGCNRLITQGAGIITSVEQFMEELALLNNEAVVIVNSKEKDKITLTKEQTYVLSKLDEYPKSLSVIQNDVKMDYLNLISVVISLVRLGLVKEVFKNHYVICS